jgi:hypothetical protein
MDKSWSQSYIGLEHHLELLSDVVLQFGILAACGAHSTTNKRARHPW